MLKSRTVKIVTILKYWLSISNTRIFLQCLSVFSFFLNSEIQYLFVSVRTVRTDSYFFRSFYFILLSYCFVLQRPLAGGCKPRCVFHLGGWSTRSERLHTLHGNGAPRSETGPRVSGHGRRFANGGECSVSVS